MVVSVSIVTHQKINILRSIKVNMKHSIQNLCFLLLLLLASCFSPPKQSLNAPPPLPSSGGIISIYLNVDQPIQQEKISINQLELCSDSVWYPFKITENNQATKPVRQKLIAIDSVPIGIISKIRFKVEIVDHEGKKVVSQHSELTLTEPVDVQKKGSYCLFLHGQLHLAQPNTPIQNWLTVSPQRAPLTDELLYILCPEINSIYLARMDQFRVIAAYAVEGEVVEMKLDATKQLLYLLDKKNLLIQRFDTTTQLMTDRIPIPLTESPQGLAISTNGDTLFVTDPNNRQVLSINTYNGTLTNSVIVGYDPTRPHFFTHNGTDYLALLSKADQQLIVLNSSDLTSIYSVAAGQSPQDTIYADQTLLVSDAFNHQILQYEPETGQLITKISTNGSPHRFTVDPLNQNILVTLQDQNAVTFLPFGQQMTVRKAACGANPGDLQISNNRQLLFVANQTENQITVLDLLSQQQISTLTIGATPTVLVIQEP